MQCILGDIIDWFSPSITIFPWYCVWAVGGLQQYTAVASLLHRSDVQKANTGRPHGLAVLPGKGQRPGIAEEGTAHRTAMERHALKAFTAAVLR